MAGGSVWPRAPDASVRWVRIWVFDHSPYPARDGSPVLEAWTTLAALSQVTQRMVLGTLVSCAAYLPPGVTVKMAGNVHRLNGGTVTVSKS